jgi:hypothetical protein
MTIRFLRRFAALAGCLALALPAHAQEKKSPSFLNEVEPLLTRLGCNQGACHGKSAGQNGFRLSLRAFAPEWDHQWLTREMSGRRINVAAPEASLMLLKGTGVVPHGGGVVMEHASREYRLLAEWIRAGAPGPSKEDPELKRLVILRDNRTLKVDQELQLQVNAEYADATTQDVTWLTRFESNDVTVAAVSRTGAVTMLRPGETAIRASFLGHVAVIMVSAPHDRPVDPNLFAQKNNVIDEFVFKKLASLHIEPSELCSDDVFLRRAFLDTIGVLPTSDEVKAFANDKRPDRRARVVDQLLERPEFVDYWTWWLDDLLQNRKESDHDVRGTKGVRSLHQWLREQVKSNRPWDELARDILTVSGSTDDNPAIGYYIVTVGERRDAHMSGVVASVAQTFLGTRIGCAQCHNHPAEKYTQDDYYRFAGFFSRISFNRKESKVGPTLLTVSMPNPAENKNPVGVVQPRTGKFLPPQPLDRGEMKLTPGDDPRLALVDWIINPKNESFAGAMVNRLWAQFMNVGLVEPIDDLRASNPPSNPELWQALVKEFVDKKFDKKHMIRLILNSRTYQLSAATKPSNEKDQRHYSHYYVRRLPAEVLLDAICQVTGVPETFEGYPVGVRAVQVPDPAVKNYFLGTFGRSERTTACACERNNEVTLPQTLHLLGGDTTLARINNPQSLVPRMLKAKKTDTEIVEEIFFSCLGRQPKETERDAIMRHLAKAGQADHLNALVDVLWAVVNTKEFAFNH